MTNVSVSIPTEFDLQMRSERGRWLRRRFLWLCAIGSLATLALEGPDVQTQFSNNSPAHHFAGWVEIVECILVVVIYALAWLYARRPKFRVATVPRLAFALVVTLAAVELACGRIMTEALRYSSDWDAPIPAAGIAAIVGLLVLFFEYSLTCLFTPWSVREALLPAAVLLAMFGGIIVIDILFKRLPVTFLVAVPSLAVSFLPGVGICWWRHSAFRKSSRLRFESAGYRSLQSELSNARRLHESCLPKQLTDGPIRLHYAYEPMRQIGGDLLFVNVRGNNPDILSVVVLDVTGHGVAAALTVNRMFGELDRLFAETPEAPPELILRGLNRYVSLTLARHGIYATALCMRLDANTGELEWANGGHPPAFLRRADGAIERLEPSATMLGVLESKDFFHEPCRTVLNAGDVVLAYTDGVSEAANPAGQQLSTEGVQRLAEEVFRSWPSFDGCPHAVLNGVLNYRQTPVEDDTLIVVVFRAADVVLVHQQADESPVEAGVISSI